ncbi:MAG: hypothetical protein DME58_04715 [Verrucomicrobia bacterium]|nr:MAG: hypothetical protein DME58_04715 [Verrucomicrobiota bacterium]
MCFIRNETWDCTLAIRQTCARRLTEHKDGASQATSYRGPWNLIYYEAYVEEADAIGRERYLKSGGGRKLLRSQLRNYFTKHRLRTV